MPDLACLSVPTPMGGYPMSSLADLFVPAGELSEASQELERSFFDSLRVKNGVYKTTYAHRLDDLNARVANYLPAARPLQVLDVAISSGVSTLEWVESFEEAGLDYYMTGIDLTIGGLLVSFGGRLHAVLDQAKWPLLFEVDGRWVSNPPRKKDRFRHFFSLALIKSALFLWAQRYRDSDESRIQRILGMPTRTRAINLVTPRLMNHPRVTIGEGNILADSWRQGTFHVIRAANILNRSYFDNEALTRIIHNLRRHLAPGGILIVCNSDTDEEAVNHATVFALREDKRFEVRSKMNGGSEVEDLILRLPN
jgi:CheR methyltransferase, SAM binding domain